MSRDDSPGRGAHFAPKPPRRQPRRRGLAAAGAVVVVIGGGASAYAALRAPAGSPSALSTAAAGRHAAPATTTAPVSPPPSATTSTSVTSSAGSRPSASGTAPGGGVSSTAAGQYPAGTPAPYVSPEPEPSPAPATGAACPQVVAPGDVAVEVANGSGRAGQATATANSLHADGFLTTVNGSYANYGHWTTFVYYAPDSAAAAREVSALLQGPTALWELPALANSHFDVEVVTGRQLAAVRSVAGC